MFKKIQLPLVATAATLLFAAGSAQAVELTTNGGFETGTYAGWTQFPTGPGGSQTITSVNPASGLFAASIDNPNAASNSLIKQANIGIGIVTPGQLVTIEFDARGSLGVGAVAFAEFFSEISGGGTSAAAILGGAPLALNSDPNAWKHFVFTQIAGPNVSGGVTLQLGATTAAITGSAIQMFYDNASVQVVPVPAAAWLFGSALGLLGLRRKVS